MNNVGRLFANTFLNALLQEARAGNASQATADRLNAQEEKLRGTGRTTNRALAYVRTAIDQAGSPVLIRDHFLGRIAHEELTQKVSDILTVLTVNHEKGDLSITVYPLVKPEPVAPLPEWASAANPNHVLGEAAKLLTKDGRKIGNGFIVAMPSPFVTAETYCIDTDDGNHVHMTEDEIHEHFYIGDFYGKIDELLEQHQH